MKNGEKILTMFENNDFDYVKELIFTINENYKSILTFQNLITIILDFEVKRKTYSFYDDVIFFHFFYFVCERFIVQKQCSDDLVPVANRI